MWGVLILGVLFRGALTQISDENLGWNFVNEYNDKVGSLWNENVKKAWNYYTNITDYNLEVMTNSTLQMAEFDKEAAKNASTFAYDGFPNATLKRLFKKIVNIGFAATNDSEQLKSISNLEADLTGIYSKGKVCLESKGCLQLEPGITTNCAHTAFINLITRKLCSNNILQTIIYKLYTDAVDHFLKRLYNALVFKK